MNPGDRSTCTACDGGITFSARKKGQQQVIANVYENGAWDRVERFHAQCYDGRYGDPA